MSKSTCQSLCQIISCLIVLTHSYFFSFRFSFVLHEICQTPATEPGNYYNLCMQIISPSKWVEGKNLILKFPVFHPFFTASLNKNSVYYLSSDF